MCYYAVNEDDIIYNIGAVCRRVGGKPYAVVKADGYGIGCRYMTDVCHRAGITRFCVNSLKEADCVAETCRDAEEILRLVPAAKETEIRWMIENGITFTVCSFEDAERIARVCAALSLRASAQIKIDSGMCRRGFAGEQTGELYKLYYLYPSIDFTGIYTHFSCPQDEKGTRKQFAFFREAVGRLREKGIEVGTRHCCGSCAALKYPDMNMDAVRIGSVLLGRVPGAEGWDLRKTGALVSPIETIREVKKGAAIGYGNKFRARRAMRVALCDMGYYNGVAVGRQDGIVNGRSRLRKLADAVRGGVHADGGLTVGIGVARASVIGAVASESMMVDVTDIDCQVGDAVTFDVNPLYSKFEYLKVKRGR